MIIPNEQLKARTQPYKATFSQYNAKPPNDKDKIMKTKINTAPFEKG